MADEDAPWLAEAAPLRSGRRGQKRPLLNIAIGVLAVAAVVAVALLMLLGRREGGSSEGYMEAAQAPLIEADPGPYKVPPEDRQGMDVPGDGEVIHEAVRGGDIEARIDMNALPEAPIGRPRNLLPPAAGGAPPPAMSPPAASSPAASSPAAPPPAGQAVPVQVLPPSRPPAAAPAPERAVPTARAATPPVPTRPVSRPAPVASAPAPTASALVQIGAFSTEAKAEEEWARVSGKGGLSGKRIEKLTSTSGRTLWRVRGLAADPAAACQAIIAANGACEAVK